METSYYKSPIGNLKIQTLESKLVSINYCKSISKQTSTPSGFSKKVLKQLDEYFSGKRKNFDLDFSFQGTDFQNKVWQALTQIPCGQTASYADIAKKIKNPKAVRAVGNANNKNPFSIVVPCHRVIGKNGKLVGYAGGLSKKEWLLKHEGVSAL